MEFGMPLHAEYVRPPFEANGFDNAVGSATRLDAQAPPKGIDRLVVDRDDVAAGHAWVELGKAGVGCPLDGVAVPIVVGMDVWPGRLDLRRDVLKQRAAKCDIDQLRAAEGGLQAVNLRVAEDYIAQFFFF